MTDPGIRPFACDVIDRALLRTEWEKWLRSLQLYLAAEEIENPVKKRNKLLHLGGSQLQEVAYNIPGAIVDPGEDSDVYQSLLDKLGNYFSPKQNSTFERHIFRNTKPDEGDTFNKFLLKVRNQANKCTFGKNSQESLEINIKDKLIDNWASQELKKKLLEKERTLEEIIELCRVDEQIRDQTRTMNVATSTPGTSGLNVNKLSLKRNEACIRCGKQDHLANSWNCPGRKEKCYKCGYQGHFASCCRSKARNKRVPPYNKDEFQRKRFKSVNFVNTETSDSDKDDMDGNKLECFKINELPQCQYKNPEQDSNDDLIECLLGGVRVTLLIDSGSKANIINGEDWETLQQRNAVLWNTIQNPRDILKSYAAGQSLQVRAKFQTTVSLPDSREVLTTMYVVDEGEISILGKETAKQLGVLKVGLNINQVEKIDPFPKIKNIVVKLTLNPLVRPIQQPVRRVPVAIEAKVETKLKEALERDIIEKVMEPSAWISPIVTVFKPNGDIRICVDMRRANEAILRENYPLPTFESFMPKLKGAKYFSRLDLMNAYHQLELAEDSRPITTFITHKGMFRYKRLMFGVNSAPEIFQRIFETMLAGCKNCLNYLDDVIVYGSSDTEHDHALQQVLKVFKEYNVLLNLTKCTTKVQELEFLGHHLSQEGIKANENKINTIINFRAPTSKEEIRSFLGLVTYVGKFLPDLGTMTEPLRQLTRKDVKFEWGPRQQKHFDQLKDCLAKIPTLSYFDPKRRTRLVADASPVALGAVLLQFNENQDPQVISFASKSLSEVERRYSQTEKESLALVWAVERFHYYVTGIEFELVTDHKPLEAIFKPTSKPPARIERWVLRLQSYKFKVIYQAGKQNIADSVSRLCAITTECTFDKTNEHHIFSILEQNTPRAMRISEIILESRLDPEISETVEIMNNDGWTSATKNPYFPFRLELSTLDSVILRGNRIVIPKSLRQQVLELAHEGHPGETVMKRRLRSKTWWPLIDREVEKFVKSCRHCLLVSQPNKPPPMSRHKFPEGPWQCLAIDLMGPLPEKDMLLVIIDYYSRYHELQFLKSTTSIIIIQQLTELFCRLGYPKSIRADNGRQFASREFKDFCNHNNIQLIQTPPYWPQANGEVENLNKSILKRLQIAYSNGNDYKTELRNFVLMYNVTPHSTTGKSPSQLMFGRNIRDKIPSISDLVNEEGDQEAKDYDILNKHKGKEREDNKRGAKKDDIEIGDRVIVQNMIVPNKLTSKFSNKDYEVTGREGNELVLTNEGQTYRRHASHVKKLPEKQDNNGNYSSSSSSSQQSSQTVNSPADSDTHHPRIAPLKLKKMEGLWRPMSNGNDATKAADKD